MLTYRFLTEEEIDEQINPIHRQQGWAELNTSLAKVMGAWIGDRLIRALTLQLFPMVGPLVADPAYIDNGEASRGVAVEMEAYLKSRDTRGWLVIANSPVTERLCERFGMEKLEVPVYVSKKE